MRLYIDKSVLPRASSHARARDTLKGKHGLAATAWAVGTEKSEYRRDRTHMGRKGLSSSTRWSNHPKTLSWNCLRSSILSTWHGQLPAVSETLQESLLHFGLSRPGLKAFSSTTIAIGRWSVAVASRRRRCRRRRRPRGGDGAERIVLPANYVH